MTDAALLARIDRLESLDQIRQLPAKYALCLDMRDMDAMACLFPEDVRVGRDASGRLAFRAWMDRTLRSPFTGTSHHTGGHVIEFDNADHAHGVVYSKNEHETPVAGGQDEWVIMQMMYVDDYVRADGPDGPRWYFARRLPLYWYATDLNKPPVGEKKMRWPGTEPAEGQFPQAVPELCRILGTGRGSWRASRGAGTFGEIPRYDAARCDGAQGQGARGLTPSSTKQCQEEVATAVGSEH